MKKLCLLLLALCLAAAAPASALTVVQPTDSFYVGDFADALDAKTEEHIVYSNDALYAACGAQIVFVAVDSTMPYAIEDYAVTLFNQWGIGSAEKNNGVLVLLAIEDDDYYLVQGRGIERNLSSGDLAELSATYLEKDFAEKNYGMGSKKLFDVLFTQVAKIYGVSVNTRDEPLPADAKAAVSTREPKYTRTPKATTSSRKTNPSSFDQKSLLVFLSALGIIGFLLFLMDREKSSLNGSSSPSEYDRDDSNEYIRSSNDDSSDDKSAKNSSRSVSNSFISFSNSDRSCNSASRSTGGDDSSRRISSSGSSSSSSRTGGGGSTRGGGAGRGR